MTRSPMVPHRWGQEAEARRPTAPNVENDTRAKTSNHSSAMLVSTAAANISNAPASTPASSSSYQDESVPKSGSNEADDVAKEEVERSMVIAHQQ